MIPDNIYTKTEKGRQEIQTRQFKLAPPLRTLLVMTDGRTRAGELIKQVAALGVNSESIDKLEAEGFIALAQPAPAARQQPVPQAPAAPPTEAGSETERFFVAQRFMNESSVNASGLRSFMLTLKLEKSNSLVDLRALLPDYIHLIEKGVGGVEAEVLIKKAKELLA